jgi:hypothetical protein
MIYYTLRAQPSTITGFMPGARDRWIRAGNRRNITADVDLSGARTAVSGDPLVQDVIGAHPDGLATRLIVAPGRARFMAPACPPRSIGQYVCVIDGTVQRDGRSLGSLSLGWQSAGTEVAVTAGPDGCAVLTVAFPEYVDVAACAAAKDG